VLLKQAGKSKDDALTSTRSALTSQSPGRARRWPVSGLPLLFRADQNNDGKLSKEEFQNAQGCSTRLDADRTPDRAVRELFARARGAPRS
jgi:hypothetical protein